MPERQASRTLRADQRFMDLALVEARKGIGRTAPNPAVGAVVVKGGEVIARGHHAKAGQPHAEAMALKAAGGRARGATLYTTLEPCNHHGRTPPCSEAILSAGIRRVVFAGDDPNPLVSGKGVRKLRAARVAVTAHVQRSEADRLNRAWLHYISLGVPFVTIKVAITADGRLSSESGDSRWITSPPARLRVHQLRDQVDAVLVGAGTVLSDDPELTTRTPGGRSPLRVVLDGRLRTPRSAKVFRPGHLLFTHRRLPLDDPRTAERLPGRRGHLSLLQILRRLGRRGVTHLLVEGGAEVFSSFLEHGLWDELWLFIAPKLAGPRGRAWFVGKSAARMRDALSLGRFEPLGGSVSPDALLVVERNAPALL